MITLSMLLATKEFSTFRLLAGERGLQNDVYSAGLFDWEDELHINKDFPPGILVLTTLSMFRNDLREAERCMKMLINNKIAAIAIKDIFFNDISDDLKEYSNAKGVPIFIFSDIYMNDIMYIVQKKVEEDMNYSISGNILERIIKDRNMSGAEKQMLLGKLNNCRRFDKTAAIFISDADAASDSAMALDEKYKKSIQHLKNTLEAAGQGECPAQTFVLYKRGFFLLLSCENSKGADMMRYLERLTRCLEKEGFLRELHIGISDVSDGASIEKTLKTAVFANTKAILDDVRLCRPCEIGVDGVIFGNIKTDAVCEYLSQVEECLTEAERTGTPFRETMFAYVKSRGNIEQTAEILHQHQNTVRYRLEKINAIFGNRDTITSMGNLFYVTRVHCAKPYLDDLV